MSKPMFSRRARYMPGALVFALVVIVAVLVTVPGARSRAHEAQARAVAEKLAVADANGDLFRHPERYSDICAGQLQAKLRLRSVQVIAQMDAVRLKSTLLSLDDIQVERRGNSYAVKVHASVRIEMQGTEAQDLKGVATITMSRSGDQWLATDYQSFQELSS